MPWPVGLFTNGAFVRGLFRHSEGQISLCSSPSSVTVQRGSVLRTARTRSHAAPTMVFLSSSRLVFLLSLAMLCGCSSGQVVGATSRLPATPRANATHHVHVHANHTRQLRRASNATRAQVSAGESEDGVAPPRPSGDRLDTELWGCRLMCQDEKWEPVCHRGHSGWRTFANLCWVHCSDSVFADRGGSVALNSTRADAVMTVTGMCDLSKESFEPDEQHSCIQRCAEAWGDGSQGGGGQFVMWRPACGEDGVTYTTSCFASCSGVRSAEGACQDVAPLSTRRRRSRRR